LFLSALASVTLEQRSAGVPIWGALALRALGAGLLGVAAFSGTQSVVASARTIASWCTAALAGVAVFAVAADAALESVVDPDLVRASATHPRLDADPFVLGVQVVLIVVYGMASIGFLQIRSGHDELTYWLGAGAMLSAFARVNYLLFPSLYSSWVYAGDILRFGAYALFVVGAQREIAGYVRARARIVLLEERRRIARELHDGLNQELSFLRSQLTDGGSLTPESLAHLAAAAERAHDESRGLLVALGEVATPGLRDAIRTAAEDVARRSGATVEVDVDEGAPVGDRARIELLRIVREATANAVSHGRATVVHVRLDCAGDGVRLMVSDEGAGFDASAPHGGFGLRSMAERAAAVGGALSVHSADGAGTAVEVLLPAT
jgi:signal transduction histidine kinase